MKKQSIAIFIKDDLPVTLFENAANKLGLISNVHSGDIKEAIEVAKSWRLVPNMMILDIRDVENIEDEIDNLAEAAPDGETAVVAIGRDNSLRYFKNLQTLGIREYFVENEISEEEVLEVLSRISDHQQERLNLTGEVVGVTGARGGVGASMIASAIASTLNKVDEEDKKSKILLLDADVEYGTQYIFFDREATSSVSSMFKKPMEVDATFLGRTAEQVDKDLFFVSRQEIINEHDYESDAVDKLLGQLSNNFGKIVIDFPFRSSLDKRGLTACNSMVIVTNETLQAWRDCSSIEKILKAGGYRGKVIIILNKEGEISKGGVTVEDYKKNFEDAEIFTIEYDAKAASDAMKNGVPITETSSYIKNVIEDVCAEILGIEVKKNKSIWAKLLG